MPEYCGSVICATICNGDKHLRELTSLQFQLEAVPFQQQLRHHGADALVAVNESVISSEAVAKSCDFLKHGREQVLPSKCL